MTKLITLVFIGGVILASGCGKANESAKTPIANHEVESASEIFAAYKENRLVAEERYIGKTIKFKSIIEDVGLDDGKYTVSSVSKNDDGKKLLYLSGEIDKNHIDEFRKIKKGDEVVIVARITKFKSMNIMAEMFIIECTDARIAK